MTTLIVSDLHIGSRYFDADRFLGFLEHGPDYEVLVLNGDIVHNFGRVMPEHHGKVLDLLSDISESRRVVWVQGTHDRGYRPPRPANIEFEESFNIGKRLLVFHGDSMLPCKGLFRIISIVARPIIAHMDAQHVSVRLAKAIPFFFQYLAKRLMTNATDLAAEGGYQAVACGHIHTVADKICGGIRYINTGTWTGHDAPYLLVAEDSIMIFSSGLSGPSLRSG
jgi:UDP-2,3-diacylglucosamine pyrophosphatase LpxH